MPPLASPSLFARLTRRSPQRARVTRRSEAADLGTELGLEHWLGEREFGSRPVVVAAPRTWWPRWLPSGTPR